MTVPDEREDLCFFADVMLGRLARWLRILGYDTLYQREIEDADLIQQALEEGRILLTRDSAMMEIKTDVKLVFMESEKPVLQLRQLRDQLDLTFDEARLFTRCSHCNYPLVPAPREQLKGKVPPYVFATEKQFLHCIHCDKIYWHGTHRSRFIEQLAAQLRG